MEVRPFNALPANQAIGFFKESASISAPPATDSFLRTLANNAPRPVKLVTPTTTKCVSSARIIRSSTTLPPAPVTPPAALNY